MCIEGDVGERDNLVLLLHNREHNGKINTVRVITRT